LTLTLILMSILTLTFPASAKTTSKAADKSARSTPACIE
jgi:hypothetical protein